jgi:hypothetical protein
VNCKQTRKIVRANESRVSGLSKRSRFLAASVLVAVAFIIAATATGCGATKTVTVARTITKTHTVTATRTLTTTPTPTGGPAVAVCTGNELRGIFAVVSGSAGAGQISYRLRVTNSFASACVVSGMPAAVQLLNTQGRPLPTHATAAQPGRQTGARIVLRPGESASADARFSPDVPGVGEAQSGRPCEPTAATLRFTLSGGGSVDAPVRPPTPVCEHGALRFSVFTAVR